MKRSLFPFGALLSFILVSMASHASGEAAISLGADVPSSSGGSGYGPGYTLGIEKSIYEFGFAGFFSGVRAAYLPARQENRFQKSAPHHLFYFGIPAGMRAMYRGRAFEPFVGFEAQLDYKAIDYKENEAEEFCDLNGDCSGSSPYNQPEKYAAFILRASPKIGSYFELGHAKLSVSTGLRADLTPFARRGTGRSKTSFLQIGMGVAI